MLAFHNDPAIKERILAQLRAHYEADEFIKGTYWESGKGCAVGCTIHDNDHSKYETELGIPQVLAHLEDAIFERMKNKHSKEWPIKFIEAIPVGKDLSNVWPKFAIWLLVDEQYGVLQFAETDKHKEIVRKIAKMYENPTAHSPKEWYKVRIEAFSAFSAASSASAAYTAYAVFAVSAVSAAFNDSDSASYANFAYSFSASTYAAYTYPFSDHMYAQSRKLLELLGE